MARQRLSDLTDWQLEHESQDVRGRMLIDRSGQELGAIREMIIDTDREQVDTLVLDTGAEYPVSDVDITADSVRLREAATRGAERATRGTERATRGTERIGGLRAGRMGVRKLPVVEEHLRVGKREVKGGGVRVQSRTTEQPVEETVHLREERVTVERHPVNRLADDSDFESLKSGPMEFSETSEEAVVSKEARVVEEVVVGTDVREHDETIHDKVRKTDVIVEPIASRTLSDEFDKDFRGDFARRYTGRGFTYDQYEPAYRFGGDYGSDPRYHGREWGDIELQVRRDWESSGKGTWENFKDAIRNGWDVARGRRTRTA